MRVQAVCTHLTSIVPGAPYSKSFLIKKLIITMVIILFTVYLYIMSGHVYP